MLPVFPHGKVLYHLSVLQGFLANPWNQQQAFSLPTISMHFEVLAHILVEIIALLLKNDQIIMQRAVVNPLIEFDETQHKPNQFALSAYKKQIQHKQILYSFSLSFKYNNKITSYITRNKQIMRVS